MADKEYIEREANCKDCICYDVCFVVRHNGDDRVLRNSPCKHFRNKADVAEVRHGECPICGGTQVLRQDCDNGYYVEVDAEQQEMSVWLGDECLAVFSIEHCPNCGAKMDGTEIIGDSLIAHGVVAQEWISVKDRLPDKGGCYLIHQKAETWIGEVIQTAHWNETAQKFRGAQAGCFMEFVTHWMPLPPAPKGE